MEQFHTMFPPGRMLDDVTPGSFLIQQRTSANVFEEQKQHIVCELRVLRETEMI